MVGFRLINLLIPGDPAAIKIAGVIDNWTVSKTANYERSRNDLRDKPTCAVETYDIFTDTDYHATLPDVRLLSEFKHLCLVFSYLTGTAITAERSLPMSAIMPISFGDGFPRMRQMLSENSVCIDANEFSAKVNLMISSYDAVEQDFNISILLHHWLDSLYFWSIEDLFLGACATLEIIKQNERRRTGNKNLHFYDAIDSTSVNYGITRLSPDFKNMRNDLIHEGHLSKKCFPGKTKAECAHVVFDVLCWVDEYVHAIFGMCPINKVRYDLRMLQHQNSYTTW